MKIKQGQLIALTNGEYSDYCLRDHVTALKDFDTNDEIDRFMNEGDYAVTPEWDEKGDPSTYGSDERFIAWAIKQGIIAPLEENTVIEWFYGSYCQVEKK